MEENYEVTQKPCEIPGYATANKYRFKHIYTYTHYNLILQQLRFLTFVTGVAQGVAYIHYNLIFSVHN